LDVAVNRVIANVDVPLHVVVSNVPAGADVSVSLTAVDGSGVLWRSSVAFRAVDGVVDLSRVAPVTGSYSGASGMGLFWSMRPVGGFKSDTDFAYQAGGFTATLDVSSAGRRGRTVQLKRRAQSPSLEVEHLRPAVAGFYGEYYSVKGSEAARPAVVVLGGSEGGLAVDALARLLASDGFPTLALAYFDEPGLPGSVAGIPLEYFAGAVSWLKRQPGVDPARVDLLGISRGAEAALLVASEFPGLVHGVVGAAPTSVVNPPQPGPRGSAWTLGGEPVPAVSQAEFGVPDPARDQVALIPVGRFVGAVMLVCGMADAVWPSCGYADVIERERAAAGRGGDVVVRVAGAGHGVASLVPYISEASTVAFGGEPLGGSSAADGAGRARAWRQLLDFVRSG
jgi:dienelactone hydrolase